MKCEILRDNLYSPVDQSKVTQVARGVRHLYGLQKPHLSDEGVTVLCLVRDGEYYLDRFIEHHFGIGAEHIVLMDNGSRDGTVELAAKYDRVTVLRCLLPFQSHKLAMRIFLAETYGRCHWCLSVDIDELWEYPACDRVSLPSFVRYLEQSKFTACIAHQLDLFSAGELTSGGGTDTSLAELCYFDLSDVYRWAGAEGMAHASTCPDERLGRFYMGNVASGHGIPVMARGVRWRLFGITPILTKIALFKLVDSVVPFPSSSHRVEGAMLADVSCVLLHMMLNRHLYTKAMRCAAEESYYDHSAHYKRIAETLEAGPVRLPMQRKRFESVDQLAELNFLNVSRAFEQFVERQKYKGALKTY